MVFLKKIKTLLKIFFILQMFSPVFIFAQSPANQQPSGTMTGVVYVCKPGTAQEGECNFADVVAAIQKIAKYARNIALEFSVIVLAFAGYKYMVSGDNSSKRSEANKMLLSVIKGVALILAAWLIVNLITTTLLGQSLSQFNF